MIKYLISIYILFVCIEVPAQDTTKVLFIGNSFTAVNNLPLLFQMLANGDGKPIVIGSHIPGGVSVGDISQGSLAHMNNSQVYQLIKNEKWDFMVIQDNQGRFVYDYGIFPTSSLVVEGHAMLRDSFQFYNPCGKVIWFAGWGPKGGYPPFASTSEGLIDKIYNNYVFLQDTLGEIIAPIGSAWKQVLANNPSINLWDSDDVHPSLNGSFLTASVIFSTIFKTSPLSSNYNPGLSSTTDSSLKYIGYRATIDSIEKTGLRSITPQIVQSGNTLTINGYIDCQWFMNNSPITTSNCQINLNQSGSYYCVATDSSGCVHKSEMEQITITEIPYNTTVANNEIVIFPNPATNEITIKTSSVLEIIIFNALGQMVKTTTISQGSNNIDISNLANGLYLLKINSTSRSITKSIMIKK